MTYDYNGDWNEFTGHLAPLYPDQDYPGDPDFHISWGVAEWTAAVPASKLAMGMPSYGRSWYGTTELFGFGARAGDLLGAAQRGRAAGHPAVRRDHLGPLRWLH